MADNVINYVDKHSPKVDERFTAASVTEAIVNQDYEFVGAKTVKVHSVNTVPLTDYQRSGANRYGNPEELGDGVQELTMTQDKAFTFTIDKMNSEEDSALNAGKALRRQTDEVIIPTVDRYRLSVMAQKAGHKTHGKATKANAYELFLDANAKLDADNVPKEGRAAIVSGSYYKLLKLCPEFVKNSDLGMQTLITGQIGEVDGVPVVKDAGRLPAGVAFMIAHKSACCAPQKLSEYKVHRDPPGISGELVEGREYYDAFVLNNKSCGICVHYDGSVNPLESLTVDTDIGDTVDLLGLSISDLQDNIAIGGDYITGTLKHVTGYTGYSGDSGEQSGNFIALHASVPELPGATITAALNITSTLDEDGIMIGRVANKATQKITFTASAPGFASVSKVYSLKRLTCQAE